MPGLGLRQCGDLSQGGAVLSGRPRGRFMRRQNAQSRETWQKSN